MKLILEKLFSHERLNSEESASVLTSIAAGEMNDAQIAAFMTVYRMREISIEELKGFRSALLHLALKPDIVCDRSIDMCGTGGDNFNSFNISTAAAFVVAAAGSKVIKHGNYGVSSLSGSSNVLEELGYRFTSDSSELKRSLDISGICFLHAPLFHPALKNVAAVRKELSVRTFFNMLGPLVNPAQPTHRLTGLYSNELLRKYNYLLQEGTEQFALVHSEDGCDEISLTAPFKVVTRNSEQVYTNEDVGMPSVQRMQIAAGDTRRASARIFTDILSGSGSIAQNNVVAINAGFALCLLGETSSPREGADVALEILRSGKAERTLKKFLNISKPVTISLS